MSKTTSFQEIKEHIKKDLQACDSLLLLLDSERNALKERKPDELEGIISSKVALLEQLELSAKQRSQWVNGNTSETSTQEQRWIELINNTHPSLFAQWRSLKDKFKECQNQNEVNGKILSRNQQVFKRILGILRGQADTQQNLYTNQGNNTNRGNQQTLGEA